MVLRAWIGGGAYGYHKNTRDGKRTEDGIYQRVPATKVVTRYDPPTAFLLLPVKILGQKKHGPTGKEEREGSAAVASQRGKEPAASKFS